MFRFVVVLISVTVLFGCAPKGSPSSVPNNIQVYSGGKRIASCDEIDEKSRVARNCYLWDIYEAVNEYHLSSTDSWTR